MRGGSVEKKKGNVDSKARPNLWFVLKCRQERRCSRKAVSISFNRGGSKAHPSKRKVYVRFDRADVIEPLLASLKYVYHVHVHIGWSVWRTAGRHVGILSARFKDPACAQVHSVSGVSNRLDVSSCLSLSLYQARTSRKVCFNPTHAQFIASPETAGSVSGFSLEAG